jgi:inosine-uridine nucleoside N-ribohydrolase
MTTPHWIIDCDPGCDDALALALLAKSGKLPKGTKVEVLTVAGNVGVDATTGNACRIITVCKKNWPVYRGCNGSLLGEAVPAASVHGRDGLGDVPVNAFRFRNKAHNAKTTAVQRLIKFAKGDQPFVLVCTGPLTNLATALNLVPADQNFSFWRNCKLCVVMGGAFTGGGNITASAEFNCHFDPVAVHLVLESWRRSSELNKERASLHPIHFVPLDVTEKVGIPLHDLPSEKKGDIKSGLAFLRAILRKYGQFHARFCLRSRNTDGVAPAFGIAELDKHKYMIARALGKSGQKESGAFCYLHDPLAMWIALNKDHAQFEAWWKDDHITVDTSTGTGRGRFIVHPQEKKQDSPSRIPVLGTEVKWLDPDKFTFSLREQFVNEVKALLAIS